MEKTKMLHLGKFFVDKNDREKDQKESRDAISTKAITIIIRIREKKELGCLYQPALIQVETCDHRFCLTDMPETRAYLGQFFDLEDSFYENFKED